MHAPLLEGRAGPCQQFPDQFCELICERIKREHDTLQWRDTVRRRHQLLGCSHVKLATPPEKATMDQLYNDVTFVDDVTVRVLDKTTVIEARKKEIQYFEAKGVYTKTRREPGMKIIATKWLDVNKGDDTNVGIRARLVGR